MRIKETLLGLVVLGLVVGGAYWARLRTGPTGVPHSSSTSHEATSRAEAAIPDVTAEDGTVFDGDVGITLSVTPRPPVAFARKVFRVSVKSAGGAPLTIENGRISFEMVMPMGDHRYTLSRAADGGYEAEVVLPFCQSGNPRWFAIVEGTVGGRTLSARFTLALSRPSSKQS